MLSERSFADCSSTGKVSKRRSTYMDNIDSSCDRRITVMLTVEGRLALAFDALEAACKARSQKRRKNLCQNAINHLLSVIQS